MLMTVHRGLAERGARARGRRRRYLGTYAVYNPSAVFRRCSFFPSYYYDYFINTIFFFFSIRNGLGIFGSPGGQRAAALVSAAAAVGLAI